MNDLAKTSKPNFLRAKDVATYFFDGKISYEWGSAGSAGLAFIGTRAEYEVAKMIPEGNEGHIPNHSLVILTDETDTVKGETK